MKSRLSSLTLENGFMRGKFGFRKALENGEIDLNEVRTVFMTYSVERISKYLPGRIRIITTVN